MAFRILLLFLLVSCQSNNQDDPFPNQAAITGHKWRVVDYAVNGTDDPSYVSMQPTFELRSDGKVYYMQLGPAYKDTLEYQFESNDRIVISKKAVDPNARIYWQINLIDATHFDFTATNNEDTDVETIKTVKQ